MADFVAVKHADDDLPCPRCDCERVLRKLGCPAQQIPEHLAKIRATSANMALYFGDAACPDDCPQSTEHRRFSWAYGPHAVPENRADVEEIEGLGDPDDDAEVSVYPLDDIMVRAETRTVAEVVRRIKADRFFMAPDFQRDFVWEPKKQSKLIESCVMRIPLPVLYVAEGTDGRIVVVDGLQRLTTFSRFLSDELALTGLGSGHPLNGKCFSGLPIHLRERVEDTQLTLYILDRNAPQRARLDIFERVNSGSVLTRQQMRNAIYNGPGTRWLYDMSTEWAFLKATTGSLNAKTMRDREAVNRFAAFRVLGWESYGNGDIDEYLARAIEHLNSASPKTRSQLGEKFLLSMENNALLFGDHAFRKSLIEPLGQRSVINISLFDVLSCTLSDIPARVVSNAGDEISARIVSLVLNKEFEKAITLSTNSTIQVKTRFEMIENALSDFRAMECLS